MYIKHVKSILVLAAGVVLLAGCTTRVADFTIVSTENVGMEQEYEKIGSTTGEHTAWFGQPDMKLAVDNALSNAGSGAAYLTNARILTVQNINPFTSAFRVTGDAWAPVSSARADEVEGYHLKTTDAGKFLVSEDGTDKVKVVGSR